MSSAKSEGIIDWAFKPHPTHEKHQGILHPIFSFGLMVAGSFFVAILLSDKLSDPKTVHSLHGELRYYVAGFFTIYWAILFTTRFIVHGKLLLHVII